MRNRKMAENLERPKHEPSGSLADNLAALISGQMEVGLEAVRCGQQELAALVACQLFDAIDWARLNIGKENLASLDIRVVSLLKTGQGFRTLEELEAYAETHFCRGGSIR
jgi:hypothetical protein